MCSSDLKRCTWSDAAKEHTIRIADLESAVKVTKQRVADFLRQGQSHLISTFARDLKGTVAPVDVGETELSHITRAQTQPRQQQQDRAVAQTPRSRTVTRSNDACQLIFRQTARQPGQPPACDGGAANADAAAA